MLTTEPGKIIERIATLEKELLEKQRTLAELRRELPPEAVNDYTLGGKSGPVKLSELFGEKSDLILIHNMGKSCSYCTLWADGFNGEIEHLQDRAAFVVCSPDAPDVQAEFAGSRGWKFSMVSSGDSTFTADMGYVRDWQGETGPWPGVSSFRKNDDGSIVRIAHWGPGIRFVGFGTCSICSTGGPAIGSRITRTRIARSQISPSDRERPVL